MVTTHRLLWIDAAAAPSAGASCSLPLAAVQQVHLKGRMLAKMPLGTPKIHVTVRTDTQRRVQTGAPLLSMECTCGLAAEQCSWLPNPAG